ncbi:PREDICTED: eukaryotic translation initiation factor 5B partial, partial [Prunus dulcis]
MPVSLKWLSKLKEDVKAVERVRRKIAKEDSYFRTLLSFENLFKTSLITEAEKTKRDKRQIERALDVMPLPKRSRGPNEEVAILIPGDEAEEGAEPMNIACLLRVVPFMNNINDEAHMKL